MTNGHLSALNKLLRKIKTIVDEQLTWTPGERHQLYTIIRAKLLQHERPVRQCVKFLYKCRKIMQLHGPCRPLQPSMCVQAPCVPLYNSKVTQAALFCAAKTLVPTITLSELHRAKQRLMRGLSRRQAIPQPNVPSLTCACGASMLLDTASSDVVCTKCGMCHHSGPVYDEQVVYSNSHNYTSVEHRERDVQSASESLANVCDRHRLGPRCKYNAISMYTTFRDNMQHVEQRQYILAACIGVGASIPLL